MASKHFRRGTRRISAGLTSLGSQLPTRQDRDLRGYSGLERFRHRGAHASRNPRPVITSAGRVPACSRQADTLTTVASTSSAAPGAGA
jgi:hypothetical protein